MAVLEYIRYTPMREVIDGQVVLWEHDKLARKIKELPQLFWKDGVAWAEANHWALEKSTGEAGNNPKTIKALMKHLQDYANWLEKNGMDWRHFPQRAADRALNQYRGFLIEGREVGSIRPSTATERMAAVIQFYRHADAHGFVSWQSPMWHDKLVVIPYFDLYGFKRTMSHVTNELSIKNNSRHGLRLEDGLTPFSPVHMNEFLDYLKKEESEELNLMWRLGFFTGARIGTITTLHIHNIEGAVPDTELPGFYQINVGPGTGVSTKFDLKGALLVPGNLLESLRHYIYSKGRLARQDLAHKGGTPENRTLLFLTVRGNPYSEASFTRLMTDLRRRAVMAGLRYMENVKFHQSRCTYGTSTMRIALQFMNEGDAIALVMKNMMHKREETTLRYVKFDQRVGVAGKVADAFTSLFSGVLDRDWDKYDA